MARAQETRSNRLVLKWSFAGLLFFPPSLHLLGFGTSYALGLTLFSATVLLFQAIFFRFALSRVATVVIFATTIALPLHLLIVSIAHPSLDILWGRALLSLLVINLIIAVTDRLSRNAQYISALAFDRIIRQLTYFLVILGFFSFITSDIARNIFGLPSAIPPFSEPSHFTLALAPFAIYAFATKNRLITLLGLAFIPFMIIEVQSLVFVVLLVIVISIMIPLRLLPVIIMGSIVIYSESFIYIENILMRYDLEYYLNRLSFAYSDNLSVLVYQQGIDLIKYPFLGDHLLGFGFQQLGTSNLGLETTNRIRDILGGSDLNTRDGSFVIAKLFSEFGIFAVLIIVFLGIAIIVSFSRIQKHYSSNYQLSPQILFGYCCIYAYVIELMFRGIGYFSIGGVLFLYSIFLIGKEERAQQSGAFQPLNNRA
ncbi:hypothetical protein [Yoonia algicola]|uniref:Uncharacterized protein n=1 Tax=Yoonia algicola TaxID=3137368 RepID=A0AAN0M5B5_9RHOB